MRSTQQTKACPATELAHYLQSPSMVCGPGRAAIARGDLTIVEAPLEASSRSKAGLLPRFNKEQELRQLLRSSIHELVTTDKSGVVLFTPHTPTSHERCFLVHWSCWAEIAMVCAEYNSVSKGVPHHSSIDTFYDHAVKAIKNNGRHDNAIVTIDGVTRSLFTTAMGPHYLSESTNPHPRYAPYFCIAIVTKESVAALNDDKGSISNKIISEAFSRVSVAYNSLISYVLPARKEHLHPFAKKAAVVAEIVRQIDKNNLSDPKTSEEFVMEFTLLMTSIGSKTPYGQDTTGIVVRKLAQSGLISSVGLDKFDMLYAEALERERPRCPFAPNTKQ